MAPKKKGQKMDLNAFLADESTGGGSWADEMDELPSGPSAGPGMDGGVGLGGSHLSRNMAGRDGGFGGPMGARDRYDDRPPRAEVPIPREPPYTAFVGNLAFEVGEPDLEDFFQGLAVKSIRLVTGPDGKPRGFGYVEFDTVDDLKNALSATGTDFGGRVVRISVAEAQQSRFGRADEASTWERSGPLAPLPGRSGGFGSGGFRSGAPGGDRAPYEEVDRDAPIRGGKFTPSAPTERRGFSSSSGPGPRAPYEEVERDAPIRGGKFTPSAPPPEREQRRMFADREPSRADDAAAWERRGPLSGPAAGGERRGFGFGGSRTPSDPPATRRPLQLSARSTDSPAATSSDAAPASSRASPFGAAKPVDQSTKEREIEERIAKQRADAAQAQKERDAARDAKKAAAAAGSGAGEQQDGGAWIRKGPLAPAAAKPKDVAPPVAAGGNAPRKAGVSYSGAAGVDDVTKGVEETKI
ncbi:hypothetical protein Rhopal_007320-T1 [Rhodotorula paludigena]|uniref:RRM domain-containing protein n=1 Tax=Rhodotorula paludigena TaxID=86838 RepID=A0AAV5GNT3_9BASI|nr:hypothetical protein Rhopal_007320-T1 [Rhodotorula paludigena]